MKSINGLKLLITIIDRHKGHQAEEILKKNGCGFQITSLGVGTASRELLEILGIGEPLKAIIFSVCEAELVNRCMEALDKELDIKKAGHGIFIEIDINSVGGLATLEALLDYKLEDLNG